MLAARFESPNKPLEIKEVDRPTPGPNEVLIKVKAAGICGSDLHHVKGELGTGKVPVTLGHEGSGIITEVGSEVNNLEVGDRVVINYLNACMECEPCLQGYENRCRNRKRIGSGLDGTFAEYITVPAYSAMKMGKEISYEVGAITGCGIATGYHATKISELENGYTVVVFGLGGIGLNTVLWANFFGAGEVIAVDVLEPKIERARKYGADLTINPRHDDVVDVIEEETEGVGADVAIECSGSPEAMKNAIESVNGNNKFESGSVISVGFQTEPIEVNYWQLREGALKVSGDHTRVELERIIKLLENGKLDFSKSVTHSVPLDEIDRGFEILDNEADVGRVVVDTEL